MIKLLEEGYVEDSLSLVRSLYEMYIHLAYFKNSGNFALSQKIKQGLSNGAYKYKRKRNGSINWKCVENVQTKEKFEYNLTNRDMLENGGEQGDVEIFNYLYTRLSKYVHPNIEIMSEFTNNNKFDPSIMKDKSNITFYTLFFATLIFGISKEALHIDSVSRTEINEFLREQRKNIIQLIEEKKINDIDEEVLTIFKKRINFA